MMAGEEIGPGLTWPLISMGLFATSWLAAIFARNTNSKGAVGTARLLMGAGVALSLAASAAMLWGPYVTGLIPTVHVYPATVWVLAIWAACHGAVGALMLAYCLARSLAGRMTPTHDIDIVNVALYWHFTAGTALVTVATIALFPLAV